MAPLGNKNGMTHGGSRTLLYVCWVNMRSRCSNPNHPSYKCYGGRGIYVCKEWSKFEKFVEDMGLRPDGYTLERIDNDGPYSPKNCKWATRKEQQRNRKTYYESVAREAERLGIKYKTLWMRMKRQKQREQNHA